LLPKPQNPNHEYCYLILIRDDYFVHRKSKNNRE